MTIDAAELKRRHSLRIAGVSDNKVYIGPERVSFNVADACNLRCQYCSSIHAPGNLAHLNKFHFLPWDKFVGIVSDCVDLNVDSIEIVGAGEPTIHPLFPNMMRHLEEKPLRVKLYTNATFPLKYCSDVMKGDFIHINLSAVNRQQYFDLHGKDLFDHVVDNIKHLVSLRDANKPVFHIDIVYIVNSLNIKQKREMQDLGSRLGVNSVYFKEMEVTPHNQKIALPVYFKQHGGRGTPPACLNGWFSVVVRVDGRTSICCRIKEMPLGNFDNWSLKELWLSESMMKMRLQGKYGHIQKKYEACKTCLYYDENMRRLHTLARNIHDH